tara:strand:- start:153 stop:299 length:147 start_codon:yes stop_codon:yes gene_type:complete
MTLEELNKKRDIYLKNVKDYESLVLLNKGAVAAIDDIITDKRNKKENK